MKHLGIDVGIDGAIAFIEGEQRDLRVELHDLPTIGEKSRREIDVPQLARLIIAAKPDKAWIENVWAMPSIERPVAKLAQPEDDEEEIPGAGHNMGPQLLPKTERVGMGAASAWRFGLGIGQIRGCVATLGIPYTLVTPQKWMKLFGLRGNDKESHRQYAIRRVPSAAEFLTLKKNHQRADALLLALWGMIYQTGEGRQPNDRAGNEFTNPINRSRNTPVSRSIDDELDGADDITD